MITLYFHLISKEVLGALHLNLDVWRVNFCIFQIKHWRRIAYCLGRWRWVNYFNLISMYDSPWRHLSRILSSLRTIFYFQILSRTSRWFSNRTFYCFFILSTNSLTAVFLLQLFIIFFWFGSNNSLIIIC